MKDSEAAVRVSGRQKRPRIYEAPTNYHNDQAQDPKIVIGRQTGKINFCGAWITLEDDESSAMGRNAYTVANLPEIRSRRVLRRASTSMFVVPENRTPRS